MPSCYRNNQVFNYLKSILKEVISLYRVYNLEISIVVCRPKNVKAKATRQKSEPESCQLAAKAEGQKDKEIRIDIQIRES